VYLNFKPRHPEPPAPVGRPVRRTGGGVQVLATESGDKLSVQWIFGLLFTGVSAMFLVQSLRESSDFFGALFSGVFMVIGIGALGRVARNTIDLFKYGDVRLRVAQARTPLGGPLEASVQLPPAAAAAGRLRVEIRCTQITWRRGKKGATEHRDQRWANRGEFSIQRGEAQFRFDLPRNLPAADPPPSMAMRLNHAYCLWEMTLHADVAGVDMMRSYSLDVVPAASTASTGATVSGRDEPATRLPSAEPVSPTAGGVPETGLPGGRRMRISVPLLIAGNVPPLFCVLFLDWSVGDIVLLYWLENVIIGVINVLRIATADAPIAQDDGTPAVGAGLARKLSLAGFFVVHYGIFCLVHGGFVVSIFGGDVLGIANPGLSDLAYFMLNDWVMLLAALGLALSHLLSFLLNFIGGGEYRRASPDQMMIRPYGRVMVVHVFIFVGGFLTRGHAAPVVVLIAFIMLKTAFDVGMHVAERKMLGDARR
jgi:hypothetical protein